jgi:hypothetical protein
MAAAVEKLEGAIIRHASNAERVKVKKSAR